MNEINQEKIENILANAGGRGVITPTMKSIAKILFTLFNSVLEKQEKKIRHEERSRAAAEYRNKAGEIQK